MRTFNARIPAAVVLVLLAHITAHGQTVPSGFVDEVIVRGLTNPTAFTILPDGRLLIAEKEGVVRVFKNGAVLATPFIDLRSTVNDYWDHGLIGIAADRDFATTGYVYLLYTYENDAADYSGPKTSRLTRVTASNDVAVPGSAVTILGTSVGSSCKNFPAGADCIPADNPSHSVGNIKVASDGTLFVTNGDAASFNVVDDDALRAQDVNSLAGKMLHITPTGQGVPGNPLWDGNPASNRSKVWAYGMRNPFRFALDPSSGMPFLGDVGWSEWEEINSPNPATGGVNLGWPCYEGMLRQSGYEPKATCQALYTLGPGGVRTPLIAYAHNAGTSAVTGGVFYTGTSFPELYQDAFFYADYAIGFVRYFKVDASGAMSTPLRGFAANLGGPVYIDTDGENLLYVAINTGEVRRIRFTAPNSGVGYLSDRPWTSMANGFGPVELDQSSGEGNPADGRVITLNGQGYAKGLGAHAPSDVRFALGGACSAFNASVGVDDEVGSAGSVVFQVWLDGVKAYDSAVMTGSTATKTISLNVTGRNELRLVLENAGDGPDFDHADWADARVTCTSGGGDTTPPTVTAVSPVDGATGVATASTVTATFSEAMTASTLTTQTMTVVPQGGVTPIAATVTYDAAATRAILAPSALLAANTTYTATVRGGSSGAKDVAGNALAADRVWTFTTAAVGGTSSYLSDRAWTSATNGWGPVERDRSNGENQAGDGAPITLNGATYAKGLGVHAISDLRYALGGACSSFTAVVGVDDEVGSNGSVVFQVWTDGVQRYQSGVLTGAMAGQNVTVNLTGANELRLVVNDSGNGIDFDHADWADARVTCTSGGGSPPTVTINQPPSSFRYKVGDVITYSGSATDPEDGTLPGSSLQWSIVIHHCPGGVCHTHPFTSSTGPTGTFTIPDHGDESNFQINLTATDSAGNSTSTSVTIQPQTVQLTLNTSPSGLQVVYGGTTATAPVTFTTIVGSAHTIHAPSPQGNLTFASWSDGGAQQHNIVVGASNVTYTATFATGSTGGSAYLSDRVWTSATNGWGPVERDRSNGENLAGDGRALTLNGVAYTKGLGAHAASDVRYALNGACTSFRAVVGVDDEVGANGSVAFQVWTDGAQRYASGVLTGAMAGVTATVDITGANELALIVTDGGNGIDYDHADWADAQVTCGAGTPPPGTSDTTPPTVTSVTPANGATQVSRTVSVSATFSEPMSPSTLTTQSVTLVRQSTTSVIPATVTYNATSRTVTLKTSASLAARTTYSTTIKAGSGGVTDLAGNPLPADRTWSFRAR